jgi:hypothetical protein
VGPGASPFAAALRVEENNPQPSDLDWKAAIAAFRAAQKESQEQAKSILDSAKSYQTTLFGLAYGGFFAIWGFSKGFIGTYIRA